MSEGHELELPVNIEMESTALDDTPHSDRQSSADKTRMVRFKLVPATIIQLIVVVASLWLLIQLWTVLLVLIFAFLIVGTMSPAVSWMESRRVKRGLGIAIAF